MSSFNPDHTTSLPNELLVVAQAHSEQIKAANRLWLGAATAIVILLTAQTVDPATGKPVLIEFLGLKLDPIYLYPISAFFLSPVNISYCSNHAQATYTLGIYCKMVEVIGKKTPFASPYTVQDVTDSLFHTQSHNRVFSLIKAAGNKPIYQLPKIIIDVIYYCIPFAGCLFATVQMYNQLQVSNLHTIWCIGVFSTTSISALATGVLLVSQLKHSGKTVASLSNPSGTKENDV